MSDIKIEEPMNPNAKEDYENAVASAYEELEKKVADLEAERVHVSRAVLKWSNNGSWQDFVAILFSNDYDVTIHHMLDRRSMEIVWVDK